MPPSFLFSFGSLSIAICLVTILLVIYIGTRMLIKYPAIAKHVPENLNPVESSLLGLLALLLAFTFNMSTSRYQSRREVLVQEANTISSVILRADLYPDSVRDVMRKDLKGYVEARIALYEAGLDTARINRSNLATEQYFSSIWQLAIKQAKKAENILAANLMLPALNQMHEKATSRRSERMATVPDPILWILFTLCCVCSFIIAFRKHYTRAASIAGIIFSVMIATTVFLILDLDRPLRGLITIDVADAFLVELKKLL